MELAERGEGFGFGVEGGNGFDEAGDGEGVADAAGSTDEMQLPADAGESDGSADERGNAGAIDLRDAVEIDNDFAGSIAEGGLQRFGELVGGFADGEAAVKLEEMDAVFFASVDFDGRVVVHGDKLNHPARVRC